MNGTRREELKSGSQVKIVLKEDQQTGKLTKGYVKDIPAKSSIHSHGIKDGLIGVELRVYTFYSHPTIDG